MLHLYQFKNNNIVLDVNSGAVHAVSDAVFDVLKTIDDNAVSLGAGITGSALNPSKREKGVRESEYAGMIGSASKREKGEYEDEGAGYPIPEKGMSGITRDVSNLWQGLAERHSKETLAEAWHEIKELESAGLLNSPAPDEEMVSPEGRGAVVKAMCLHVAHDCNMRCAYCFADAGGFSGERALMPPETGKAAIDFLLKHSAGRRNLEIDFFGGEPLMNFDVVKALVLYGRAREKECGKSIRFTITTNGLLLDDEKAAFINEHMDNVVLSLDGRPEVNDRMRKTPGGDGTYALIIDKLVRFAEARKAGGTRSPVDDRRLGKPLPGESLAADGPRSPLFYVRGTYTAFNKDFAEDFKFLADLGFNNISIEPVVTGKKEPWTLTEDDLPELYAEYDRLADVILEYRAAGKNASFFHFNVDLEQGPCVYKRASGCGAGTAYVAVTPEGDIYPCHQFAGDPAFLLGNVRDEPFANPLAGAPDTAEETAKDSASYGGAFANPLAGAPDTAEETAKDSALHDEPFANPLAGAFEKAHIFAKKDCRGCWAKYYCSGGCHANAFHIEGDLMKPHRLSCALEKKRLEIAIGLAALSC